MIFSVTLDFFCLIYYNFSRKTKLKGKDGDSNVKSANSKRVRDGERRAVCIDANITPEPRV